MQHRATITRQRILYSAAALFNEVGFSAAAVNDIIAVSGVTKGAMYFHFQSKEALAQWIIEYWSKSVVDVLDRVAATEASAARQLVMVCHELARDAEADVVLRSGLRLSIEPAVEGGEIVYRNWVEGIAFLVSKAIASGEVRDTPAARRFGSHLCVSFIGAVQARTVEPEGVDLETWMADVFEHSLGGILTGDCPESVRTSILGVRLEREPSADPGIGRYRT